MGSFVYINLLGALFGMPWVSHGSVYERHVAPFGLPWGALGLPLVALGEPGVPFEHFPLAQFLATGNLVCHEVTHLLTGSAILELATAATGATRATDLESQVQLRASGHTRRGPG